MAAESESDEDIHGEGSQQHQQIALPIDLQMHEQDVAGDADSYDQEEDVDHPEEPIMQYPEDQGDDNSQDDEQNEDDDEDEEDEEAEEEINQPDQQPNLQPEVFQLPPYPADAIVDDYEMEGDDNEDIEDEEDMDDDL